MKASSIFISLKIFFLIIGLNLSSHADDFSIGQRRSVGTIDKGDVILVQQRAGIQHRPNFLLRSEDWTAAVYEENGSRVCYAFNRSGTLSDGSEARGVMLTVTHRANSRNTITVSFGKLLSPQATVVGMVGSQTVRMYLATREGTTFAAVYDGLRFVRLAETGDLIAFSVGGSDIRSSISVAFSGKGFSTVYGAISRACRAP